MRPANSMVENGVMETANRKRMCIHERLRSERLKWFSCVCWPTQKIPSVMKVMAHMTSRGASAPSASHRSCSLWTASTAGARRSSTSSVMATANTPSLRAAERSTLWPALHGRTEEEDSGDALDDVGGFGGDRRHPGPGRVLFQGRNPVADRKSTRLNSSHLG